MSTIKRDVCSGLTSLHYSLILKSGVQNPNIKQHMLL